MLLDNDASHYNSHMIRVDDDKNVLPQNVVIGDINIHVRNLIGDPIQIDCTCDSDYMKDAMVRVGMAIRESYSWIPLTQPCWLVMDNAGGHGTKECIVEYKRVLLTD